MDTSYMDKNGRKDFELTKNISLGMINPISLLELKTTGKTSFVVPELLFDLDYPGHYRRRIKSVSVSIYCVTGPFTTINATIRLKKHYIRKELTAVSTGFYNITLEDYNKESIATSTAQNDSGIFAVNFNDERYLPFEGCGAVSEWEVELVTDKKLRQFDYSTINDVVLHVKYTARENGAVKNDVMTKMNEELQKIASSMPLYSCISARNELSGQWYLFQNPQPGTNNTLEIPLTCNTFPYFARSATNIVIKSIGLHAKMKATLDKVFELSYKKSGVLVKQDVTLPYVAGKPLLEKTVSITGTLNLADIDDGLITVTAKSVIPAKDLEDFILTVQYVV
jgi:hypothetical protein